MEFNILVKTILFPILQKYGFEIVEEFKDVIRFQSPVVKINLVFNNREMSHLVEIGEPGKTLYPLTDHSIKLFFGLELPIEHVTSEIFAQNLSLLFETEKGLELLNGNIRSFTEYELLEIEDFNATLMRNQLLESASKAWDAGDFMTFVKNVDEIGINKTPHSYQLKYKIAKQKM